MFFVLNLTRNDIHRHENCIVSPFSIYNFFFFKFLSLSFTFYFKFLSKTVTNPQNERRNALELTIYFVFEAARMKVGQIFWSIWLNYQMNGKKKIKNSFTEKKTKLKFHFYNHWFISVSLLIVYVELGCRNILDQLLPNT